MFCSLSVADFSSATKNILLTPLFTNFTIILVLENILFLNIIQYKRRFRLFHLSHKYTVFLFLSEDFMNICVIKNFDYFNVTFSYKL